MRYLYAIRGTVTITADTDAGAAASLDEMMARMEEVGDVKVQAELEDSWKEVD